MALLSDRRNQEAGFYRRAFVVSSGTWHQRVGEEHDFGMGQTLIRANLPFTSSVMIGESLKVSGPLFSHL